MKISFICPVCKNNLEGLRCADCAYTYNNNNGIPSFICRQMYANESEYLHAQKIINFWGSGWKKRLLEPDHSFYFTATREQLIELAEKDKSFHLITDSVMPTDRQELDGRIVLNIGCGAGAEALILSSNGGKIIAVDITIEAVEATKMLVENLGGECVASQSDSRFLPLADASVDIVYSSGVLHHSENIEKSISEILRVLKPNGKAYIMLYATWSVLFIQQRLMCSMGEGAWETGKLKNPHTTTFTISKCRHLFSKFKIDSIKKTGETFVHLAVIGRFIPKWLDPLFCSWLGPRLNIVATKITK